jgi:hypothetical protein
MGHGGRDDEPAYAITILPINHGKETEPMLVQERALHEQYIPADIEAQKAFLTTRSDRCRQAALCIYLDDDPDASCLSLGVVACDLCHLRQLECQKQVPNLRALRRGPMDTYISHREPISSGTRPEALHGSEYILQVSQDYDISGIFQSTQKLANSEVVSKSLGLLHANNNNDKNNSKDDIYPDGNNSNDDGDGDGDNNNDGNSYGDDDSNNITTIYNLELLDFERMEYDGADDH